ncbi:MAG: MBL fold metallo-hydrolase, partial [Candidatus Margulisiibacteriota bacterium]
MLTIETIPVTLFEQNARILHDQTTNDCVIVDPGGDIPLILSKIPLNSQLKAIWITHSHIDDVSGVSALIEWYQGVSVIALLV